MEATRIHDVVILGYGPVGATLALLLGQQELDVAILEREAGYYHLARAGHFDAEIMRVFQSVGLADAIEPITGITEGMRFVDAEGTLLMEWKRGGAKGSSGWVSDYMFHQPDLEKILRSGVQKLPNVKQRLLHDVYAIEEAADHVTLRAEDTRTTALTSVRGRFVVGCDGARSLVRRTMGVTNLDLGFKQRWLVVDVQAKRELNLDPVSIQQCSPERPMFVGVTSRGKMRWEFMLKPDDDPVRLTRHDTIWDLIGQSVRPVAREDGEIIRAVAYTFESLIANDWKKGRLLLAGDSAHRMPPFLGQGMCAGVRDASNLAWKLAAVCQGRAPEALLDTYASERRPHVEAFCRGAVEAGRFVQLSDPVAAAERVRQMRDNPKAFAPPNPALGPGLRQDHGAYGLGRQFVQPVIDGALMDDLIGHAFALVGLPSFIKSAGLTDALASKFPALKIIALPDGQAHLLEPYAAQALILRPDRYVHAAVSTQEELQKELVALDGLLQ